MLIWLKIELKLYFSSLLVGNDGEMFMKVKASLPTTYFKVKKFLQNLLHLTLLSVAYPLPVFTLLLDSTNVQMLFPATNPVLSDTRFYLCLPFPYPESEVMGLY